MNRRTADVVSRGFSNLFVLQKDDLETVLKDYDDAKRILNARARKLMKENEERLAKEVYEQKMKENAERRKQKQEKLADVRLPQISHRFQKLIKAYNSWLSNKSPYNFEQNLSCKMAKALIKKKQD